MRKLNHILLFLGSLFLVYLLWRVGPRDLATQIAALGWGVMLLVLAEGAANLAHAVGWRHCISNGYPRVPLPRLFRMATAGYAINYLTPTASVGGEISRAALLSSTHGGSGAATSVLLDKLMTAAAHLLLVTIGAVFLFWRVPLPLAMWTAMGVTTALVSGGMAAFLLMQKRGKLGALCRWLAERQLGGGSMHQMAQRMTAVDEGLKKFYRDQPRDLMLAIGWHFIGHSVAILHAWLFLFLLGQPAPLLTVVAAGFLSLWFDLLTFFVPMNLGTLEGSRILVFRALGCQALLGMTFGVALRIAQLFWACFGLVFYGWSNR